MSRWPGLGSYGTLNRSNSPEGSSVGGGDSGEYCRRPWKKDGGERPRGRARAMPPTSPLALILAKDNGARMGGPYGTHVERGGNDSPGGFSKRN